MSTAVGREEHVKARKGEADTDCVLAADCT